jgi:CubicO group peptidase (beta-lactamase class C family)
MSKVQKSNPIISQENAKLAGLNVEQLNRLSNAIHKDIENDAYDGGAVVMGCHGVIGLKEAVGYADRKKNRALHIDDVFNILSVTKAFTDVLALSCVERGDISLTTRVTEIIPEFKGDDKDSVTLLHVFTHTAGSPPVLFPVEPRLMGNMDAIIAAICKLDLVSVPGTKVSYSPLWGHAILGEIIRRLDSRKRALRDIFQEDLFGPLAMRDTALGRRRDLSSRIVPIVAHSNDFGTQTAKEVEEHNSFIVEGAEIPWMGGVSTAPDLFRFAEMLRRGGELDGVRILSPITLKLATTIQTGNMVNEYHAPAVKQNKLQPGAANIGLDFLVRGEGIALNALGTLTSARTFGKFGQGGTGFWVDPENDVSFVFLRSGLLEHFVDYASYQKLSDMAIAAVI